MKRTLTIVTLAALTLITSLALAGGWGRGDPTKWSRLPFGRISVTAAVSYFQWLFGSTAPTGTTVWDESGNSNDATLSASNCLTFDGATTAVTVGDSARLSFGDEATSTDRPFSVAARIRSNNCDAAQQVIVSKFDASTTEKYEWMLLFPATQGKISFAMFDPDDGNQINSKTADALDDDTWYNVIGCYDGSTDKDGIFIYINGVVPDTTRLDNGYGNMENTTAPCMIGCRINGAVTQSWFNGDICDVRVWDVRLNAAEIAAYETGEIDVAVDHLIGFWPLAEGKDTLAYNVATPLMIGRIAGGVWGATQDAVHYNLLGGFTAYDSVQNGEAVTVWPDTLEFGLVEIGMTATATISIKNHGDAGEFDVVLAGTGYTTSLGATVVIGAGEEVSATVSFAPTSCAAKQEGTLTVNLLEHTLTGYGWALSDADDANDIAYTYMAARISVDSLAIDGAANTSARNNLIWWSAGYYLYACVSAYEVWSETRFLDLAMRMLAYIMPMRDCIEGDNEDFYRSDYSHSWGSSAFTTPNWTVQSIYTGLVAGPIVKMARLIAEDGTLGNPYDTLIASIDTVRLMCAEFEGNWSAAGDYGFWVDDFEGIQMPINYDIALAGVYAELYAYDVQAADLKYATRYANYFADNLSVGDDDRYEWSYWPESAALPLDDFGHATTTLLNGIMPLYDAGIVFVAADLAKFANSFIYGYAAAGVDVATWYDYPDGTGVGDDFHMIPAWSVLQKHVESDSVAQIVEAWQQNNVLNGNNRGTRGYITSTRSIVGFIYLAGKCFVDRGVENLPRRTTPTAIMVPYDLTGEACDPVAAIEDYPARARPAGAWFNGAESVLKAPVGLVDHEYWYRRDGVARSYTWFSLVTEGAVVTVDSDAPAEIKDIKTLSAIYEGD